MRSIFTRTDSAGNRNFLTDALGSTVALTDSTGVVQTQYTYDPFGATSFNRPAKQRQRDETVSKPIGRD